MEKENLMQIKVCGMRDPKNLEEVCRLSPEYVGFIFYPRSKRFVGHHPDTAIFEIPGPHIKKVGVFVDEDVEQVRKAIILYDLDAVQLHGQESADYCRQLLSQSQEVIKALDPHTSRKDLEKYRDVVDLFLFDSAGAGQGGSGQKFDWSLLEDSSFTYPFILSGGIGPGDAELIRTHRFRGLRGVDVNSRFEFSPGLKNIEQLKDFMIEIRK